MQLPSGKKLQGQVMHPNASPSWSAPPTGWDAACTALEERISLPSSPRASCIPWRRAQSAHCPPPSPYHLPRAPIWIRHHHIPRIPWGCAPQTQPYRPAAAPYRCLASGRLRGGTRVPWSDRRVTVTTLALQTWLVQVPDDPDEGAGRADRPQRSKSFSGFDRF